MKIKSTTPNKNEFAKFEIIFDKEDFKDIVDYTVEAYIHTEYDSDLYNEKGIINAVSKCESFKEKVVREILHELNSLLPEHTFTNMGLGDAWEESSVCQKIEEDIRSKRSKKEESREIKDAKRLLKNAGYVISK